MVKSLIAQGQLLQLSQLILSQPLDPQTQALISTLLAATQPLPPKEVIDLANQLHGEDERMWVAMAQWFRVNERPGVALDLLGDAVRRNPHSPRLFVPYVRLLFDCGLFEKADAIIEVVGQVKRN
jgi:hypothetical protein